MIWLVLAANLLLAVGWAGWLAGQSGIGRTWPLIGTLALALNTGGLSLLIFGLGLLRLPLTPILINALYIALMLPGWALMMRAGWTWPPLSLNGWTGWVLALLLGVSGAVLLNAVLWPFYRDDALGIYVPFALTIVERGGLAPVAADGNPYALYPQLMSMNYAYVYLHSGWANPYPARVLNALLSLAVLPATYLLGRVVSGRASVGWAAAVVLALSPDVGNWASAGYVDLPAAFFIVMAAALLWAGLEGGRTVDVGLAALMVGLAAWTKNAALLHILIFFTFTLWGLIRRQISVKQVMLACMLVAFVASPWYIRNLLMAGSLTPDTVWSEQARQTLHEVFILIARPQNYSVSGWLMAVAFGVWGMWTVQGRIGWVTTGFLLGWSLPLYVSWLVFASYDPRFVLLMLPFWAVMAGWVVVQWGEGFESRRMPRVAIMIVASLLAFGVMWRSVEYKRALLTDPFMTHADKSIVISSQE